MKKGTFVTGLPLTQAERDRYAAQESETLKLQAARRRACPSGQRYNKPSTAGVRKATARMVGSE